MYTREDLERMFWRGWLSYEDWDNNRNKHIPSTDDDLECMIHRIMDKIIDEYQFKQEKIMEQITISKAGLDIVLEKIQDLVNTRIGTVLTEYDWRDLAGIEKILIEAKDKN